MPREEGKQCSSYDYVWKLLDAVFGVFFQAIRCPRNDINERQEARIEWSTAKETREVIIMLARKSFVSFALSHTF
jgi:hypothetical protein